MKTQIELLCEATGVAADQLHTVTTLYASGNSGITDAGLALCPKLTTLDAGDNSNITKAARAVVAARKGGAK